MRQLPILMSLLVLTACKPSEMFGPDAQREDRVAEDIAPAAPTATYPSGIWEDGLGNAWSISIVDGQLAGEAATESIRGLLMIGVIDDDTLTYQIGFPDTSPLAHGMARLTFGDHAQFETVNADGTLNAHGLLHFNHSAGVPTGQPMDLRPAEDGLDQTDEGE